VCFGCFVFSVALPDHLANGHVGFLQWGFAVYGDELHGLEAEPYVLAGVSGMLRLEVTSCFLLLIGQLVGQLATLVALRGAGVSHVLVVVLYRCICNIIHGK
jgi:hypothetical protein